MIDNVSAVEMTILGQIVLYGDDAVHTAEEYISPNDFESSEGFEIYKAAREITLSGKKLDFVMLEESLGKEYRATLMQLAESSVTLTKNTYETNLRVLQAHARERRMQEILGRVTFGDYANLDECRDLLSRAMQCLDDKDDSAGMDAKEGFLSFLDKENKPKNYVKSGISKLDKYLKVDAGDMIVIGGRPSAGKTAITLQMMVNAAREKRIVYFSLETREEKIFDRILANYTNKPLAEIKHSQEIKDDGWWSDVMRRYDSFASLNFKVVNAAGWTVNQIFAKARREQAEVIFIDYLGLVRSDGKSQYEKATNASNDVHTMAQRSKITTYTLCQLNRDGKERPDMTSLRDSGAIEQDADAILLLSIPDSESDNRLLEIVKNKEGQCGGITLTFDGERQKFYELEERYVG